MRLKFNATAIPVAGFINEAQKYAAKAIQAKEIAGYFEANFCKSLKNNKYFAAFWKRLTKSGGEQPLLVGKLAGHTNDFCLSAYFPVKHLPKVCVFPLYLPGQSSAMVFVSITRLRLRSAFYLVPFFWHTFTSTRQLVRDSRFIKGKTLMDKRLTFWTMTLWQSEADMRAYRNTDAHKKAMSRLQHWCDEASVTHWQQEGEAFPTWAQAHQHMQSEGWLSKVKKPSATHSLSQLPAPHYPSQTERILLPKGNGVQL